MKIKPFWRRACNRIGMLHVRCQLLLGLKHHSMLVTALPSLHCPTAPVYPCTYQVWWTGRVWRKIQTCYRQIWGSPGSLWFLHQSSIKHKKESIIESKKTRDFTKAILSYACSVVKNYLQYSYGMHGVLMVSVLETGSNPGSSPGRGTALGSWARHFVLIGPLFTLVYKWVPTNLTLGDSLAVD